MPEHLTRFERGASHWTKQQFARDLMTALDRLDVKPGDLFLVDNIQPRLEVTGDGGDNGAGDLPHRHEEAR